MCGDMGGATKLRSCLTASASSARGRPVLSMAKPDNGEKLGLEAGVRVLRGLVFAAGVLLGLVFAVACYAEMLGIVRFE